MATFLTLKTFDYNNINDGTTFAAFFELPGDLSSSHASAPIEAPQPGTYPAFIRSEPQPRDFTLRINCLGNPTRATFEMLSRWFSPDKGERYLMADDDTPTRKRMLCSVQKLSFNDAGNTLSVLMHSETGFWEADVASYQTNTIAASGTAIAHTNAGDMPTPLKMAITPTSQMNTANGLIYRRRMPMANRSELELSDPVGDGYAVDLGQDAFDTATLQGASKIRNDLFDLRVYNAGADYYRWTDPSTANGTSKVFINGRWAPARKVTLAAAMASGSVPAAGSTFILNNPEGTDGLPSDTFVFFGTEAIHVQVYSRTQLLIVQRGALGTTAAAHSANDPGYVIQYPYLFIFYGWSGASDPAPPDDRKPVFDLTTTTNLVHHWTTNFLVPSGTRRSMGWYPEYTDEGGAATIRQFETGGTFVFEDNLPVAGKPRYNNLSRDFPVPVSAAANSVEFDMTINNNLVLVVDVVDLAGLETVLVNQGPTTALVNQQFTPTTVLQKIRFNGRIGLVLGFSTALGSLTASLLNANPTDNGVQFKTTVPRYITGVVLALNKSGGSTDNLNYAIYTDNAGAPGSLLVQANPAYANANISAGALAVAILPFQIPILLDAGTYWITCWRSGATGSVNFGDITGRQDTRMIVREGAVNSLTRQLYARVLSRPVTPDDFALGPETAARTALQTGEQAILDNFDITLDNTTPRTPLIVMGGEESMYLVQNVIQNVRNLIANSSFESNTTGHAATGTSTIARSAAQAHFDKAAGYLGKASLLCTYGNSTILDDYAITLPLANQSYVFSTWLFVPSNWDGGQIQLAIANFAGSSMGTAVVNADMTKVGQWQRIVLPFSVAADAVGDLQVKAASAPTAGRFIYLDDMQCEPGTEVYAGGYFPTDGSSGGETLSIYFPMALNQRIEIDCERKLVWDGELNLPIPFACSQSNPEDWLKLCPGLNIITYTETGVTGLTFETRFRSAWL